MPENIIFIGSTFAFIATFFSFKYFRDNLKLKEENEKLKNINSGITSDKIIATDFDDYTKLSGSPIHLLCEGIFKQIDSVGAKNFYEMRMKNAKTGDEFEILFQKVGGETPVDQLQAARKEIERLNKEILNKNDC